MKDDKFINLCEKTEKLIKNIKGYIDSSYEVEFGIGLFTVEVEGTKKEAKLSKIFKVVKKVFPEAKVVNGGSVATAEPAIVIEVIKDLSKLGRVS